MDWRKALQNSSQISESSILNNEGMKMLEKCLDDQTLFPNDDTPSIVRTFQKTGDFKFWGAIHC